MSKRVLIYADNYNGTTGYSRVGTELARRLVNKGCDVYFQQIVDFRPIFQDEYGVKVMPAFGERGSKAFLIGLINNIRVAAPDVIIPISDTFLMVSDGLPQIEIKDIDFIPYVLVDANNIPDISDEILDVSTKIITASYHGQKQLEKNGYDSEVLYHGVDLKKYVEPDINQKNRLKVDYGFDKEDKIFLFVGRNFVRKRPGRLIDAILKFNKDNPDNNCKFYLHMSDISLSQYNLKNLIAIREREYDTFSHNIIFGEEHSLNTGVPETELIKLYKMSDFYISASSGEGFGLPIVESMACGSVPILADNTTTREFIDENRGFIADNIGYTYVGYNTTHDIVNIDELKNKIEEANNLDEDTYKDMSKQCVKWVRENCNWDDKTDELYKIIGGK